MPDNVIMRIAFILSVRAIDTPASTTATGRDSYGPVLISISYFVSIFFLVSL